MFLAYLSVTIFALSVAYTLKIGYFLPAFFLLCYMLPFLPLLAAPLGMDVVFWTGERFVYAADSAEVSRMQQIWLSSSVGVILGLMVSRLRVRRSVAKHSQQTVAQHAVSSFAVLGWHRAALIFLVSAGLISLRLSTGSGTENEVVTGYELIVCLMLLLCWTLVIHTANKAYFFITGCLTLTYVWSQVQTGDRDFFLVIIALALRMGAIRSGARGMLAIGALGLILVLAGAVISMVRLDVDLTAAGLFEYMAFNSWNATILPVLLMVEGEANEGGLLYGKTYLDLILSVPPSPIFSLLGIEKPIQADNPALWFFIPGLGGMHVVGVALRNFDLVGVVLQSFLFVLVLAVLERRLREAHNPWKTLLYLCVSGAMMHTIWYGFISIMNTLVFYLFLYFLFSIRFYISTVTPPQREFCAQKGEK
ncbi:MAG: hypothetical protein JSR40_15885 [Proteobacteria bacterium]|nr:hypothetical protein [Pseudomonadota bacterium]